jgi:hypothetical protein
MADHIEDIDMDDAAEQQVSPPGPKPQFRLDLLSTIRTCQSQNGVNHGDYGRYRYALEARIVVNGSYKGCQSSTVDTCRQFCTSRLANLYKALKMQHGKGRYQKRKLEVGLITDVRCALIIRVLVHQRYPHPTSSTQQRASRGMLM